MAKKGSTVLEVIIVTIITIVAGLLLGVIHNVTAGPIAEQQAITLQNGQKAVFGTASEFELLDKDADELTAIVQDAGISNTKIKDVYAAKDASGEVLGYIVDASNNEGYGGDVEILAGITAKDGTYTINGISFLELSETAGMGMKAQDPPFIDEFTDLEARSITVTGDDPEAVAIDAISGATITSKAVAKDVNAALAIAINLEEDA